MQSTTKGVEYPPPSSCQVCSDAQMNKAASSGHLLPTKDEDGNGSQVMSALIIFILCLIELQRSCAKPDMAWIVGITLEVGCSAPLLHPLKLFDSPYTQPFESVTDLTTPLVWLRKFLHIKRIFWLWWPDSFINKGKHMFAQKSPSYWDLSLSLLGAGEREAKSRNKKAD